MDKEPGAGFDTEKYASITIYRFAISCQTFERWGHKPNTKQGTLSQTMCYHKYVMRTEGLIA